MHQHRIKPCNIESRKLEHAKMHWLCGDWESLARLADVGEKQNIMPSPELAMLVVSALMQFGDIGKARDLIKSVSQVGVSDQEIFSSLVSGVHNTLGRANALLGRAPQAREHILSSLELGYPGSGTNQAVQLREREQLSQLGLPAVWNNLLSQGDLHGLPLGIAALELAKELSPQEPSILIALAEAEQRRGEFDAAIRSWQELASLLQESMPQIYYDRLDEAYQKQNDFPLGFPEEEELRGNGDKHELLRELHEVIKPRKYLEIGVQTGKSFLLAECEAIGIDPMPRPNIKLRDNHVLLRMTSDEFFSRHAGHYLPDPPDLVFIDGMHLFEFALRDFMNVERYSSKDTVIVIDDIFPGHPAQAERERRTRAWTGDVWKLAVILEKFRPDLVMHKIDVFPTGLLIIQSLCPGSKVLEGYYTKLTDEWRSKKIIPESVLKRAGAISYDEYVAKLAGEWRELS